jgi:hypothetical protein
MPSPFPGMDPYLEDPAFWQDFHRSFVTYCRDMLMDRLPSDYEARIDEQVRLVERSENERQRTIIPDVAVTRAGRAAGAAAASGAVATLEPVAIPLAAVEEQRDVWIEIFHRPERSLVTVIELLSPSNKNGDGYGEYRIRRRQVIRHKVHLVELDLLLGGRRIQLRDPLPEADYYAFVTRADADQAEVYSWSIRDPLPTIPIPLKSPDPDIGLNIAEVVDITYDRGRYTRSLRYDRQPPTPLPEDTMRWAVEQARRLKV